MSKNLIPKLFKLRCNCPLSEQSKLMSLRPKFISRKNNSREYSRETEKRNCFAKIFQENFRRNLEGLKIKNIYISSLFCLNCCFMKSVAFQDFFSRFWAFQSFGFSKKASVEILFTNAKHNIISSLIC